VRRLFFRAAAAALCVTVGFGVAATPSLAADAAKTPGAKAPSSLTRLSPASREVLAKSTPTVRRSEGGQQTPATPGTTSGGFFKSTKGKVTLVLMGAGVGFTIWSISHDREPVKSPIR
jgi:hypothetical protein